MDQSLLIEKGVNPASPTIGFIDGYQLQIGKRAMLVKSAGKKVYGVVMELTQQELDRLYSEPSVADYKPQNVEVIINNHKTIDAVLYNVAAKKMEGKNKDYVIKLMNLANRLGLPEEYIREIMSFA